MSWRYSAILTKSPPHARRPAVSSDHYRSHTTLVSSFALSRLDTCMEYSAVSTIAPLQRARDCFLGSDLMSTLAILGVICTSCLYNIVSHASSVYSCILSTTIECRPTCHRYSTVVHDSGLPRDPGMPATSATSNREHGFETWPRLFRPRWAGGLEVFRLLFFCSRTLQHCMF